MEYCVLGSGSGGNATYVRSGDTRVLIDAGITARQIRLRLATIGVQPEDLDAIVVTHEHNDHISGIRVAHRQYRATVYCQRPTARYLTLQHAPVLFEAGEAFSIGPLTLLPFAVPHDAEATVGFRISNGGVCMGYVTDAGMVTRLMVERLKNVDALVIESNHDEQMLWNGPYTWELKQRIAGEGGHLSNARTAELLRDVRSDRLQRITLAHLSEQNNDPALARDTAARGLDGWSGHLETARQHEPLELARIVEIKELLNMDRQDTQDK